MLVDSIKSKDRGFWYNVVGEGNKRLADLAANKKQAEEYSATLRDMYGISNFADQAINILSLLPYAFVVAGVVGVLLAVGVLVLGAFKREAPVKEEPKKEQKS